MPQSYNMSSSTSSTSYHSVLDLPIPEDDLHEFSWLVQDHKGYDFTFEYEEKEVPKTIEPFRLTMPYDDSPPSSLSTMNEDGGNSDIEYSESDSDAEEDPFWSTHEELYRVVGGHAYPISVLEDAYVGSPISLAFYLLTRPRYTALDRE